MAHQTGNQLLSLFGFLAFGDFADMTTYKSQRGKIVWFPKTWPDKPPSEKQLLDRLAFSAAAEAWNALPEAKKEQWRLAARRASIVGTGYNLYMYCWLAPHNDCIPTIARQTRCDLDCACFAGES